MGAKWQAPLIEMMSRSGSAETGVDPDAATERQTVETTSRMVKEQETPEPKATKVLARATQATERAQVAVHRSRAHARSRRAAVRELLTAVTIKSTVTIKTEEVAMESATSWMSWMRAGRVEREIGTGCTPGSRASRPRLSQDGCCWMSAMVDGTARAGYRSISGSPRSNARVGPAWSLAGAAGLSS